MPVVLNAGENGSAVGGQVEAGGLIDLGSSNQVWVETRADWNDDWSVQLDLVPRKAHQATLSAGISKADFEYNYGPQVKPPDLATLDVFSKLDFTGHWVRIRVVVDRAPVTIWIGRIEAPVQQVEGDQRSATPSGKQQWVAYGMERYLQKIGIHQAIYQYTDRSTYALDWLPGFNTRGVNGALGGNRSAGLALNGNHTFGGTAVWDGLAILEYVLRNHVEQGAGLPYWGTSGTLDFLEAERRPQISPEEGRDALALIRTVCDPRYALDAVIVYDQDAEQESGEPSFLIHVYSLLPATPPIQLPGVTFPVNTARVPLTVSTEKDGGCTIEFAETQRVDKLLLRGDRIRSVFSVGDTAVTGDTGRALAKGWTAAEEAAYKAGDTVTSNATAVQHDLYRADDRFRPVFQRLVVDQTLALFDFDAGWANPIFNGDGTVKGGGAGGDQARLFQRWDVGTLASLPLQANVDYSVNPPTNRFPPGVEVDFLSPFALVKHPALNRYVAVERLGDLGLPSASVEAAENAIGVQLSSSPRHFFARGDWADAPLSLFNPRLVGVDWRTVVATIAVKTDHRLQIEIELPAQLQAGDGSVRSFDEPLAQAWWLSRYTVLGVTPAGAILKSPATGYFVREDSTLLKSLAAGAVARYLIERVRAAVQRVGRIEPWQEHLGAIGDLAGEQGSLLVATPFTTVSWDFTALTTTLLAGQADRG